MEDGGVITAILNYGPVFLLIAVRAFAMIETAPLLSSESVPRVARLALAGLAAFAVMPASGLGTAGEFFLEGTGLAVGADAPELPPAPGGLHLLSELRYRPFGLGFVMLLLGEAMIGVIMGFFLTLIFTAFSTAGQFFSIQMGFAASEAFDPLAQVENPVIGQFLHLVAMLVFVIVGGFRELFLGGFWRSVQSLNVLALARGQEHIAMMMATGLSRLFLDALVISLPILGTLFLISLTTGLISKAAPQINILSEGFPIAIMVGYLIIFASLPFMVEAFAGVVDSAFSGIQDLLLALGRQIEGGRP
ncbi:MAG: flagellar biosynthetic protein FliR [Treponema sp.]|nr:flagellar biosynthetic protein FliR [Treponema sp.]